jgi:hypothetical protein
MNAIEINKLQAEITEMNKTIANTTVPEIVEFMKAKIAEKQKLLADSVPENNVALAITRKVNSLKNDVDDITRYDDLHPRIAIKSIVGSANNMISSVLYLNDVHAAITAKHVMQATSTSSWNVDLVPKGTSPMKSDEDRLIEITEECASALAELATLLVCYERAYHRCVQDNVELSEYDEFPDVAKAAQRREASAVAKAAQRRAAGAVAKSLTPNVVSMLG